MKRYAITAAVILSTTTAILCGLWASRPATEVFVAQRGTAIATVYGTVKAVAAMTVSVRARSTGTIHFSDAVLKNDKIGLDVKEGELLATIVSEDLEHQINEAEAWLKAAEERERLGPPSQPGLNTQEAYLARLEKPGQSDSVAAVDVERIRNEVQTLRERVRAEQVELERAVTIERAQVRVLQDRKTRCSIVSPIDGYLSAIDCLNNEFINDGSTPFTVATKSTFLDGQINEEDVGLVAPKMRASVRLYSYANQDFTATVDQVFPTPTDGRYSISLTLDKAPPNLMAGMTGEMNIITEKHANALVVPARAVLGDHVWVVKGNVVRRRAVKVGLRNLERAEILDGLKEGEQVVVADQDLCRPGQRVRAVTVNM
jgi:RND family efflux transporter MFP subunit